MKQKICVIFLCTLFFLQHPAFAQKARLSDITVTNTHDGLEVVYLNVKGTFTEKMREAVLSGVPTTFLFYITLQRKRRFWPNKEILNMEITHTIKYHNLKKEFVISRSWEKNKSLLVRSFREARKLMNEIHNLKIVLTPGILEKGEHYQLKAKARLSKMTLPFDLHYILFFVSLWDFETDWYVMDLTY